jgi:hypothetical protein
MIRNISFTDEGHIRVESESTVDVIHRGVVLLTLDQAITAKLHGWKLDEQPFSKETTPWLYSVRKP